MPIRPGLRDGAYQLQLHPLVDHAKEAQPGARNGCLIGRLDGVQPRCREVRDVDAAGKREYPAMTIAFSFVQTLAASKDHIRATEQFLFALEQFRRGAAECRQLVHAVEHNDSRGKMTRIRQCHRRVVPNNWTFDPVRADELVDKPSKFARCFRSSQACRNMRYANKHAMIARDAKLGSGDVEYWFFKKKHAARAREPCHQMLWPLEYKVPTQMGETD